jgi:uncharacterized protein (TIGR02145 family)
MKKVSLIFSSVLITAIIITSCDNFGYEQVKIGDQVWMKENLNVDKFRNGDPIPEAKTREEWIDAGLNNKPAWCYYGNDSLNSKKYGKLYNFHAVSDPRGLAPKGWKIPTADDWEILINNNGGYLDAAVKLKNTFGWDNKNGSNESGFTANAGGERSWNIGDFSYERKYGYWWTSSVKESMTSTATWVKNPDGSWTDTGPVYEEYNVNYGIDEDDVFQSGANLGSGLSVRLIKE